MPKSNVRVFLRLRPTVHSCESIVPQPDGKSVCIQNRKGAARVTDGAQQDSLLFKFDGIYQVSWSHMLKGNTERANWYRCRCSQDCNGVDKQKVNNSCE